MDTIALLEELIRKPSVTPADHGCQQLLAEELSQAGFTIEHFPFGAVSNLAAWHGQGAPVFAFLGHTDVVPAGPEQDWSSPPFSPVQREGLLYGRGAADMKGSLAAMVSALQRFVRENPRHPGTVGLLVTSDEEGTARDGVRRMMPALAQRGTKLDYCLVGEPSSDQRLGDVVRIGRRGSLNGLLTVRGVQGHVAYPDVARNPIHEALPALERLVRQRWDEGTEDFPPTSLQISNLRAGHGSTNVIPGQLQLLFNFRFSPASTSGDLENRVATMLDQQRLDYQLKWQIAGEPFYTEPGLLNEAVTAAVQQHCGIMPELNTGGGTSDGRFVAPTGAQVVELGPVNASIHQIDEHVSLADIETLAEVYLSVLEKICQQ